MMKASIGIDMGGTSIKLGLVSNGVIIDSAKVPASAHVTLQQRLHELIDPVDAMLKKHGAEIAGVGIAFPGIVDSDEKRILSRYVKYPDAQKVDFAAWAQRAWRTSFAIENDARAALLGEWQYGAGRGCQDLVLITLGTGVGSAVMINGKLLRGKHYRSGNLGGHMSVNLHGRKCNCGNTGCVESEASTWALQEYLHDYPGFPASALSGERELGFESVIFWAERGDALALKVKESCLKAWSFGILNLLLAFDPEKVVIGGGIMKSKHAIIPFVKEMMQKNTWISDNKIEVVAAEQVEHAGILGMALLASEKTVCE